MREKDKENLKDQEWSLRELIDIDAWQKIQDNFSAITDVCLRTVDAKGNPITLISKEPRLCRELLKDHSLKNRICGGSCLPTFLGGTGVVDRNLSLICKAGFYNFVTPLRVNAKVLGYLILGPLILVMRKSKEQYRTIAEELGLSLEEFWSALLEIKVMSFHGVQSLVELIRDVGEYTLKLAYQNIMKGEEMPTATDSLKLSRLLNVLLEVAFQVTKADIGSIMFSEDNELTIRASRGLPEEIVRNVRVRLGEGISGIAAKERISFLIDDDLRDTRIKPYLKRPQISSAMVLPIKIQERVMGVMNLGALKTSTVRFSPDNLQLMHKLIDLATLAITPIK